MQNPLPPNVPVNDPVMQALPLRDIKLPPEPGFWPLAPGWWVLIIIAMVLLTWLLVIWVRHRRRHRHWQSISEQLAALELQYQQHQDSQQLLVGISELLRRFVRHQLQQPQAATLNGQAWIDYLNACARADAFNPFSEALSTGPYQAACAFDEVALLQVTRRFMQHQVMRPQTPPDAEVGHV